MNPNLERAMREKDFDAILKSEYSEKFDKIRKEMMVMSCYHSRTTMATTNAWMLSGISGNVWKNTRRPGTPNFWPTSQTLP